MTITQPIVFFWFRRDLRIFDNHGLYEALRAHKNVCALFIFDTDILDALSEKRDARVDFIHTRLLKLDAELRSAGSALLVHTGKPIEVWRHLADAYTIEAVYTNRDYEPYARRRDEAIFHLLAAKNIPFRGYKDQVIFEKNELLTQAKTPYTVFTPYSRSWKAALTPEHTSSFESEKLTHHLYKLPQPTVIPSLSDLGFSPASEYIPAEAPDAGVLEKYDKTRDFPAIEGTSRLGIHLRFGTISIRQLVRTAQATNDTYLNELIWREFYQMILFHFPHCVTEAIKPAYDQILWRNNEEEFRAWCEGRTGYPIVDAGMRQLNDTGYMHNRVRMITASFLTKHLLIDWRRGEAYFAEKLLDFELASNVGGWQWAAGSGCDAAPYFRIFNPTLQMQKFDPELSYVKKWVPEYGTPSYPPPIIEHTLARARCLAVYKSALEKS